MIGQDKLFHFSSRYYNWELSTIRISIPLLLSDSLSNPKSTLSTRLTYCNFLHVESKWREEIWREDTAGRPISSNNVIDRRNGFPCDD